MNSVRDAAEKILLAWPTISEECCSVLGSELHYQAMIYHCLRTCASVPIDQIGMNVKMWIESPKSDLFAALSKRKHKNFQVGFEPIPDVVLFSPQVHADWRRRKHEQTLPAMLAAIEVKASERAGGRLRPGEINFDIEKLAAHREEALMRGSDFFPVMMVIDSAPCMAERMTPSSLNQSLKKSSDLGVGFLYISPGRHVNTVAEMLSGL